MAYLVFIMLSESKYMEYRNEIHKDSCTTLANHGIDQQIPHIDNTAFTWLNCKSEQVMPRGWLSKITMIFQILLANFKFQNFMQISSYFDISNFMANFIEILLV